MKYLVSFLTICLLLYFNPVFAQQDSVTQTGTSYSSEYKEPATTSQQPDQQPKKAKNQSIGIRGGYHSAVMKDDGSKLTNGKSVSSFYVGIFRERPIIPMLSYSNGLEYFQNGVKFKDGGKRKLHTLSIPSLLKFELGPIFATGGAAINIKVAENIDRSENLDEQSTDKSNWFDFAPFVGGGIKILFFTAEGRYHWGLVNALNGGKNRYFQLGLTYSF